MNEEDNNILVVGTGLIGTSIALGLTAQGLRVFLSDIDSVALDNAIKVSGATKYADQNIAVVFVATPPASVAKVIAAAVVDHPNAVITDVASVKGSIFRELEQLGTSGWDRIVGGHPMAGREVSGAIGAQGNLFLDRPWVIASSDLTSPDAISTSAKETPGKPSRFSWKLELSPPTRSTLEITTAWLLLL